MESDQKDSARDTEDLGECKIGIRVKEEQLENGKEVIPKEKGMEIGRSVQDTVTETIPGESDIVKTERDVTRSLENLDHETAGEVTVDKSNTADEGSGNTDVKGEPEDPGVKSHKTESEISSETDVPEVTEKTESSVMGYRGDDEESDTDSDSSSDDDSSSDMETIVDEMLRANKPETKTAESLKDQGMPKMCQNGLIKSMREEIRTRGEVFPDELPPIEDLTIKVEETEELMTVGKVTGIVDTLVVVQSEVGVPALNEDSILFKANREVFGKIFEVFGPVCSPLYSVRFNSGEDIQKRGVEIGHQVYCAPRKTELTQYVFVDQLKTMKGSDASWEDNHEPPEKFVEFSDDEEERRAKAKNRKSRQGQGGRVEENGTGEGPPQRVARNNRHRQHQHSNGKSINADRQHGYTGQENPPNQFHSQQNIHSNPRPRPRFTDYNSSGPGGGHFQAPRQTHPGEDVPHRFPGPAHMARPRGTSPRDSPQQFAGPPQFRKGPNYFPNYQPPLHAPMFGAPRMPQFGHYQECQNSSGFQHFSLTYGGAENPSMCGPPLQGRTSLLGPSPGSADFGGLGGYGGTLPATGMGCQTGIPQRQYGYETFEHLRGQPVATNNSNLPPPIDRRYIQKSNMPNC